LQVVQESNLLLHVCIVFIHASQDRREGTRHISEHDHANHHQAHAENVLLGRRARHVTVSHSSHGRDREVKSLHVLVELGSISHCVIVPASVSVVLGAQEKPHTSEDVAREAEDKRHEGQAFCASVNLDSRLCSSRRTLFALHDFEKLDDSHEPDQLIDFA